MVVVVPEWEGGDELYPLGPPIYKHCSILMKPPSSLKVATPRLNGQTPPTECNTSVNTETGGSDHDTYSLTDVEK